MNENYVQLVNKAREGDQQAMTDLYAATSQRVYYSVRKLVGNDDDAQDLTSETYLTAFGNLDKLAEPKAFPKWISAIAVNLTKDFLKKKKPVLFSTDEEEERVLGAIPEESEDCLPEVFVQRAELRRQVVELIDALPEAQKTTVYLHYLDGRSVEEVAEIMEVNENTVKSRLNYARSKLRKLAERSGLTASVVSVITLVLREECKAAAVPLTVNKAVMGVIANLAGAGAAAGAVVAETAAGAAAEAAAVTSAAAAGETAAAVGLGAKIAALPVVTKIIAAVAAVGVVVGAGVGINSVVNKAEANPHAAFIETVEEHGGLESFIGMTGEEIKAVLGEENLNEDEYSIYYHLDDTVGFVFNEPFSTDFPCLHVYSFSEKLPILDIYGCNYEQTLEFISGIEGRIWTEDEPASFDNAFSIYVDDAEFLIYLYVDNIRYAILSDAEGFVTHIDVTDYVLYDQIVNGGTGDVPAGTTDGASTFRVLDECDPVGMLNMTVSDLFGRYGETYVNDDGTFAQYEYNGEHLCCTIENGIVTKVYGGNLPVKDRFGLEAGMKEAEAFALFEKDERILESETNGTGITFRTANVEYRITFHDGGVQFDKIIAGDFDYDYDALYAAVSGFPGTETGRLTAELTGDKRPELVVVSKQNEGGFDRGYITVYTVNDGAVEQLWQTYTSTIHAEERTYYLYNDGSRDYILDCVYYMNQGYINYSYLVHGFTTYGAQQNFYRGSLEGELSVYEDDIPDFMDEVNSYTRNSTLLLDGQNYDLYVYGGSAAQGEGEKLEIILTGEFTEVNGGVKAKANTMEYVYLTDSELRSLKPGDVVDLTYAGYGTVTVENIEIDGMYAYINGSDEILWFDNDDGNWYFEYPSAVPYTYRGGSVVVFFPEGLKITDWSSGNGMSPDIRSDVREIPSWAYGNGMTVTVKNGAVTEATLNFRP